MGNPCLTQTSWYRIGKQEAVYRRPPGSTSTSPWSQVSPPTPLRGPGTKRMLSGLHGKYLYPVRPHWPHNSERPEDWCHFESTHLEGKEMPAAGLWFLPPLGWMWGRNERETSMETAKEASSPESENGTDWTHLETVGWAGMLSDFQEPGLIQEPLWPSIVMLAL